MRGFSLGSSVQNWNQIRESEQIHEIHLCEPFALRHQFVLHHGDVRGRASEGKQTQPGKNKADFLVDFLRIGHRIPPIKEEVIG